MTEASPPARNAADRPVVRSVLLAILLLAAVLRVRGIGFGLPALNDPDEPLFMMTALDMLRSHSINPQWFGHPGTITFYCLALISLAVAGAGTATGRFADADAFVGAVYADPSILFLPARLFFAACGVLCVYLSWRLGRRVGGDRTGLIAAAILAANALHIDYSQLIRTDIQASLFILLCAGSTLSMAERGHFRDYLLAGVFVGLGCATKWPAAAIAIGPLAVGSWRVARGHGKASQLLVFVGAAVAALLFASPYLLIDHGAVVRDLAGEARPRHPGATGEGLLDNLAWYLRYPLAGSLGLGGVTLAIAGPILMVRRNPMAAAALGPVIATFLILIAAQSLRWERWLLPVLPFAAIAAAYALHVAADALRSRFRRPLPWFEAVATVMLLVPMLQAAQARAMARGNDTRQLASSWLRTSAPRGSTILVEHAALDLLSGPWTLLFPLGQGGCVDARAALGGRIRYSDAAALRAGTPVIDLGNVDPRRLSTCSARFLVLSHFDRYLADYPAEALRYATVTRGASLRYKVAPVAGERGGPTIFIFERPQGQ